jgi:hypothetical protein
MGSRYVRRLTGDSGRDLDTLTATRALEIAAYLYDTNPVAKRVLEVTRDFVLGEGITVSVANDPAATDILKQFWTDPINMLDQRLHQRVLELGLYGEQCWTASINPISGHAQIGYIDPAQIKTIEPNPTSPEDPYNIVLQGAPGEEKVYSVVTQDTDPLSPSYGRLTIPNRGSGACFMFRINTMTMATRGRSDLLALADWIDAYDQLLFSELDRALLMKSFLWDVTLTGADQRTIDKYVKDNPSPKPGSYRVHNEKVVYGAVAPNLNMSDTAIGADLILAYISAGAGLPKTWLAGSMDVNRATAIELSDPAIKRLASRQRIVRFMLERICTFALDQAELHGRLPRRMARVGTLPTPWEINLVMADIRGRDLAVAANTLEQVCRAIALAKSEGVLDQETSVRAVAAAVRQLGISADPEFILDRTEAEQKEKDAKAAELSSQMFAQGQGQGPQGHPTPPDNNMMDQQAAAG